MDYILYADVVCDPIYYCRYDDGPFTYGIDGGFVGKVDSVWGWVCHVQDVIIMNWSHVVGAAGVHDPGIVSGECLGGNACSRRDSNHECTCIYH